jgi:hypothetical protein
MLTTYNRILLSSVNLDLFPISELNVDHQQQATPKIGSKFKVTENNSILLSVGNIKF